MPRLVASHKDANKAKAKLNKPCENISTSDGSYVPSSSSSLSSMSSPSSIDLPITSDRPPSKYLPPLPLLESISESSIENNTSASPQSDTEMPMSMPTRFPPPDGGDSSSSSSPYCRYPRRRNLQRQRAIQAQKTNAEPTNDKPTNDELGFPSLLTNYACEISRQHELENYYHVRKREQDSPAASARFQMRCRQLLLALLIVLVIILVIVLLWLWWARMTDTSRRYLIDA